MVENTNKRELLFRNSQKKRNTLRLSHFKRSMFFMLFSTYFDFFSRYQWILIL